MCSRKCISPSADPAKEVHRVVYDDLFPEMAVIFYEIQMDGMLLVG
jgi:hypothetical protein